jgi:hypothetical protein
VQTYDINYLNMAKTSLKVLKVNSCRLKYLTLEAFACLKVGPLGYDGSVLLSVVTQALLYNFLVCRFLLLFLSMTLMTAISGKSRLLSAGFCTKSRHRSRVAEGGFRL